MWCALIAYPPKEFGMPYVACDLQKMSHINMELYISHFAQLMRSFNMSVYYGGNKEVVRFTFCVINEKLQHLYECRCDQ